MQISEKLYNDGYISYPRTETDIFEPNFNHKSLLEIQQSHELWGDFAGRYIVYVIYV